MSMTKLLAHLGSFVLSLLSYAITYSWELYKYHHPNQRSNEVVSFCVESVYDLAVFVSLIILISILLKLCNNLPKTGEAN
jgi:hypothetical protein